MANWPEPWGNGSKMTDELEHRRDLAATLRYTARLGMNEGIANHYSLALSPDGAQFLMNPYGRHWSQIRASDLLILDALCDPAGRDDVAPKGRDDVAPKGRDDVAPKGRDDVDPTAWAIHSALHRRLPQARCIMHLHSKYATVLACLKDSNLPPIDQTTMRFHNRIAYDEGFDGMGLGDEAERIAGCLGNKSIMLMGQHGVLVTGPTVAQCFDTIYYFERAADTYITALTTGRALNIASDAVAEKTAQQWEDYPGFADKHLAAIRSILDAQEPDYRN
jgi:ribulose-5-phosphate 4-epimerase/fuculose-1-phosphate aldolase